MPHLFHGWIGGLKSLGR